VLLKNSSGSFMLPVSFIKLATFPVLIIRCLLVSLWRFKWVQRIVEGAELLLG
jgi:hypothetical protein